MKWLNKSCRWCFLVFSKIWGIFLDPFFRSWTQIRFSTALSSRFCCRRLRWGLRASLGNTSLIAVSLNDIQQRYLFFLNKIYLAPVQGSAFSLYSLNFPGVAHFSWLPAFTALARAAEYISLRKGASRSFRVVLLQALGFVPFHPLTMQHILASWGCFLDIISAVILYILVTVCNGIKTHIEKYCWLWAWDYLLKLAELHILV